MLLSSMNIGLARACDHPPARYPDPVFAEPEVDYIDRPRKITINTADGGALRRWMG